MTDFRIELATIDNSELIHKLVKTTFDYDVAPDYSSTGIKEFYKYIVPDAIKERLAHKHFILLAKDHEIPIGLIEIRNNDHISMFFIIPEYQKKGIGKQLLNQSILRIKKEENVDSLTVNSSPNAAEAYKKMGFVVTHVQKEINGIRFIPMKLKI